MLIAQIGFRLLNTLVFIIKIIDMKKLGKNLLLAIISLYVVDRVLSWLGLHPLLFYIGYGVGYVYEGVKLLLN